MLIKALDEQLISAGQPADSESYFGNGNVTGIDSGSRATIVTA